MKTKVMEVITYKKQTSKTNYIVEAALEYRQPLNITRNFFSEKKYISRGFCPRKYGSPIEYCPEKTNLMQNFCLWYLMERFSG